ncbi:MAG: isoprenylcysteine carboxylmethyltransferase family protein [Leptolyngbyaceae cyanobacterium bins.349]|nr:isoprenylcysteine carboxylmethyltransferase family protein [Leptolyngbyaceae cyanobacterium bins.349]
MGFLRDWGFSANSWQGQRGEYWVLVQVVLILGFAFLPSYPFGVLPKPPLGYGIWAIAVVLAGVGLVLFVKGLLDLGHNLTPLPHPRNQGELVQSGVYGLVRHPVYSGVIFVAIAWALYLWSLSHLIGAVVLLLFFEAKARQEEAWLTQKHPDYLEYQQRVKKLIPWVY